MIESPIASPSRRRTPMIFGLHSEISLVCPRQAQRHTQGEHGEPGHSDDQDGHENEAGRRSSLPRVCAQPRLLLFHARQVALHPRFHPSERRFVLFERTGEMQGIELELSRHARQIVGKLILYFTMMREE